MIGARTLKFHEQIATDGDYLECDLETNRITTDETGRSFPFVKVPMGLEPGNYYYLSTNFSRIILSFNYLLPSISYLLID